MPAVRGTRLRAECPRRPCRTVPSSRRKSHQHRPHPHNGFLRRESALCAPAAIPPIDGSFPVYLPLQYAMPAVLFPHIPKISRNQRISHRRGVFSDFRFSNYVVFTTEFGTNSPNSPSRRARQHRNLKFRCFSNVNNFAKRKCTHISGSAASNRGTHPQACRITSDPALVSLSCLHANASTFFLAPSNRTPPNRIPLKPSAPPSPLRAAPPSRHKSHPTP